MPRSASASGKPAEDAIRLDRQIIDKVRSILGYSQQMSQEESSHLERFCRQIETRSFELNDVMPLLIDHRAWIMAGSVLRMQVESLCRAVFLLSDSVQDREERLVRSFEPDLDGKFPTLSSDVKPVTDTRMARLADEKVPGLRKSATSIYKLGCRLVHLSLAHDYRECDPYRNLPEHERRSQILDPLSDVWGDRGLTIDSTFAEVMEVASPLAFRKLNELLQVCLVRLRAGEGLDPAIDFVR